MQKQTNVMEINHPEMSQPQIELMGIFEPTDKQSDPIKPKCPIYL